MESGMDHYADKSLSFKEASPSMYGFQSRSADIQPDGDESNELQSVAARGCREDRQVLAHSEESERKEAATVIPRSNSSKADEGNAQFRMLAELPESLKGSTLSLSETDSSGDEQDKLYKDLCKAAQQTSRQDEVLGFSSSQNRRPGEGTLKKVCDSSASKWCVMPGEKILEEKYQRRSSSESSESSLKKNLERTLSTGKGLMEHVTLPEKDEASSATGLVPLGPVSLRRASQEGMGRVKRKLESDMGKGFVSKETQEKSLDVEMLKESKCSTVKGAMLEEDSNNEGEDNDTDDDSDSDSDSESSSSDSDDDDDDEGDASDSDSDSDSDEKSEEKLKTIESKKYENKEIEKADVEKNILETDHERMKVKESLLQDKEMQSSEIKEKDEAKATKTNQPQSASASGEANSAGKADTSISDARVMEEVEKCPPAEKEKSEGSSSAQGKAETSTSDTSVQSGGKKVYSEVSAGESGKVVRQSKDRREDRRRDTEANGDKENDSPRDNTKNIDKSTKSDRKAPVSIKKQQSKGQRSSPLSSAPVNVSEVDLVQQVAVAFAQQLTTIQGSQAKQSTVKSHSPQERPAKGEMDVSQEREDKSELDMAAAEEEKMEMEIDDTFPMPIQAEVVMSEGSESGIEYEDFDKSGGSKEDFSWYAKREQLLDQSEKENLELVAYLQSFVS